jgi:hypothetical protein
MDSTDDTIGFPSIKLLNADNPLSISGDAMEDAIR